eukprot:gene39392-47950_t
MISQFIAFIKQQNICNMDASLEKKAKLQGGKKDRKACSLEFNSIRFPAQKKDTFRATLTTVNEGVLIWVENKKTKQQWQTTVTDMAQCGPAGFPEDAVIAFMEEAFELAAEGETKEAVGKPLATSSDCPSVDFEIGGEEVTLTLTISFGRAWKPKFVFSLLPVALDKIDVLEAKLRDAQEELEHLRAGHPKVAFLSLASKTACGPDDIVQWDDDEHLRAPCDGFVISADNRQITVVHAGIYQVNVRLAGSNRSSYYFNNTCLLLNDVEVASCDHSFCTGGYKGGGTTYGTAQLQEILRIPPNGVLQVRCGFHGKSHGKALSNRFSILRLGD